MGQESQEVDMAETFSIFTKNQFLSEFKNAMENDCSKDLRQNMVKTAKFHIGHLNQLNIEFGDFVDIRLRDIQARYSAELNREEINQNDGN